MTTDTKEVRSYVKHFVECNCILQIFKGTENPPFHKFPVFSEVSGLNQTFIQHFAVCPNCGAVHKVLEVGLSKIQRKETVPSLRTKEEIASGLPDKIVSFLEKNDCDLPTYQEAEFVIQHSLWGKAIILSKERQEDGSIIGKALIILGETLAKVENFEYTDIIDLNEEKE